MPALSDLLSRIDSTRRVAGRNISDMLNNPLGVAEQIDDRSANYNAGVVPTMSGGELYNRPLSEDEKLQQSIDMGMNFAGGGMGTIGGVANAATRMHNMGVISPKRVERLVGPKAHARSQAEIDALEKEEFMKYLQRENPQRFVQQNPGQGFAPDEFSELAARVRRPMNDLMNVRTD